MIEFSDQAIKKAETLLGGVKDALPKAQVRVINRCLQTARAEAVRAVREDYAVDASDVRKTMEIKNAGFSNPTGTIISTGNPIDLAKFDVSPSRPNRKSKNLVTVRVKLGSGRKPIKNAFLARLSNGHVGIFIRANKARFPIKQLYGPSVPQMLGSEGVSKKIEDKAVETMEKRLDHEIDRILEGH
ncbi:MAG: Prophage minor tail family protein [Firmicutes bacterium]|nr:Prophage minor tail family protein [Bacillota bacterium]